MRPARGLPALLVLFALLAPAATVLAGCGGSSSGDAPGGTSDVAQQGQVYAASVAAVTQSTSTRLAQIARTADYQTAPAAQSSTRAYATTIRTASDQLAKAKVPGSVRAQHAALVALYRATADRMDVLATTFGAAKDVGDLAAQAQAFSAEVQSYSSRELQLRSAIETALAAAVAPPAVSSTPGLGGTSDPG